MPSSGSSAPGTTNLAPGSSLPRARLPGRPHGRGDVRLRQAPPTYTGTTHAPQAARPIPIRPETSRFSSARAICAPGHWPAPPQAPPPRLRASKRGPRQVTCCRPRRRAEPPGSQQKKRETLASCTQTFFESTCMLQASSCAEDRARLTVPNGFGREAAGTEDFHVQTGAATSHGPMRPALGAIRCNLPRPEGGQP